MSMADMLDDDSTSITDNMDNMNLDHQSRSYLKRPSEGSTSSNGTVNSGIKRHKDMPPCFVCGAKANGYNFDQSKVPNNRVDEQQQQRQSHMSCSFLLVFSHLRIM
jgi:ribosomal protein L34E